jgi:ferredoxin
LRAKRGTTGNTEMTSDSGMATSIRSQGGDATSCSPVSPKLAALVALASLPPSEPLPAVTYNSRGNLLVIAGAERERALVAARRLATDLHVTLLGAGTEAPATGVSAWSGEVASISGHLGEFVVVLAGLRGTGVARDSTAPARFDLVLDFSARPLFPMRQPPQGYFRAPASEEAFDAVLAELRESVGEFEKPRFFHYRENLCAHSRSQVTGCTACIDICSTAAIRPDGDHVKVDPHLCMGCGACATVCPSGAMGYQFPKAADRATQVKQLLGAHRAAGAGDACIVFHEAGIDPAVLASLPERALPLEAWNVAAIGLDVLLPAIAFGARQVVLAAGREADGEYVDALRAQMEIGQTILTALGYAGSHFEVIGEEELAARVAALPPAATVAVPATFMPSNDKRTAIEFAVEHLARHAPARVDEIALPEGSPFGEVKVDASKCTMCMSCVGACPESALMDGVDKPLLRFLERNCVQCGLCEATCPEEAISLSARLLLTPAAREARVLNETQPFHCISCNKPFGTRQMVDAMMGRLASHSMFAGGTALQRLQMCADCRVVDMMKSKGEVSVLRLGAGS